RADNAPSRRRPDLSDLASPEVIRQRMAKTRSRLTEQIQSLKAEILGTPKATTQRGKKNMATKAAKKTNNKSSHSRKEASKARATRSTASNGRGAGAPKKGHKTTTVSAKRKVKQTVNKALTGAAIGAVQGAVNAVASSQGRGKAQRSKASSR